MPLGINITLLSFWNCSVDVLVVGRCRGGGGGGREQRRFGTSSICIGEVTSYFALNGRREEVALYRRDAFGRLGGDDIDSYDSAIGFCSFDSNLFHILLIRELYRKW